MNSHKKIERNARLLRDGAEPSIQSDLDELVRKSQSVALPKPKTLRHRIYAALLIIAVFLPVGLYLQMSYVAPDPSIMHGPFGQIGVNSYSSFHLVPGTTGDSAEFPQRSAVELYEDDKKLGPAHSPHFNISVDGKGAYSHWSTGDDGYIIIFSTSDNSNPNTNGRTYKAVKRAD